MEAATAPTPEIANLVSHRTQFELVLAGGIRTVDVEQDRGRGITDAIDSNAIVIGAVTKPDTEAGDVVLGPDVTIIERVGQGTHITDQADIEIGQSGGVEPKKERKGDKKEV